MRITEVRIKLMEGGSERLQAFCSITFDDAFVIRDLKIIEGTNGPFVAMPSRKLTSHCPQCGCKNHLRAAYCNQCGQRQKEDHGHRDHEGRVKLYADIAHPINSVCREMIQERVISEFRTEQERAKLPGYVSRYDDYFLDDGPEGEAARQAPASQPPASSAKSPIGGIPPAPQPSANEAKPETKSLEQPRVEPAESQPRGPHRAGVNPPANSPSSDNPQSMNQPHIHPPAVNQPAATPPAQQPPQRNGGFGAGIF